MPAGQRTQRRADPAADGELRERGDARGSGDPDADRTQDALRAQRCDPAQDRPRLEAELRDQRHVQAALVRECHLRLQRRIQRAAIDRRMAFGIAGKGDAIDAVAFDHPGRQQVEARTERADRAVVAADEQDADSTPASPAARCRKSLACVKLASRRAATCGTGTKPARRSLAQAATMS